MRPHRRHHQHTRLAGFVVDLLIGLLLGGCAVVPGHAAPSAPSATSAALATTASVATTPVIVTSATATATAVGPRPADPVPVLAQHPRLLITAADLPRLRAWASDTNPLWTDGLAREIARVRAVADGHGNDDGSIGWVEDPVEADAELLAFASMIEPSTSDRAADAQRARRLLMTGIDAAAAGPLAGAAYRDPGFSLDDRSRWWGESWALTADWIHDTLSAHDRAEIRTVFLRWTAEEIAGGQTTDDHPPIAGVHDDPALLADRTTLQWAGNNYFTAHERNVTLMSLALDPADDPDGALRGHLADATGGFLYMTDALLRGDERGGAPADGLEYGPQALGYVAQTLLALHTAGVDDASTYGRQVRFDTNPFWDEVQPWLLSAISPAPVTGKDGQPAWLPAGYGDTQTYHMPNWIELFGTLGAADQVLPGHDARLATSRWIAANTPDGGVTGLADRIANPDAPFQSILGFLLFDPAAPAPADPRPPLPLLHVAPGTGRVDARTGWDANASWFDFGVSWNAVDHQNGDGLSLALFRKGEWLTKERAGYDVFTSDEKNTLGIQNGPVEHNDPTDYRGIESARGSQFTYVPTAPGQLTAVGSGPGYVYVAGDATGLYDSASEGATDVTQATRDVVWLQPDVAVVYDRATTATAGRFKRFFLQLPSMPRITGTTAVATTAGGQQLAVTTLAPSAVTLHAEQVPVDANGNVDGEGQLAIGEPMTHRLEVDATGDPADVRFLHVLQGLDAGASPATATHVTTTDGSPDRFEGAAVGTTLVLFPVDRGPTRGLDVTVPGDVTRVFVAGLAPGSGWSVTRDGTQLRLAPGDGAHADAGGVLDVNR